MPYKEIGELYLDEELKTGIINNRNNALAKKTLLYPDSDRLLYNYTRNPHIRDTVYYIDNENERLLFIGKDVFINYNVRTGNFYVENPHYILRSLCKPIAEGGLALSQNDLFAVSENLQYALLIEDWVYIISKKLNGNLVFFRYNILTEEISNYAYDNFTNTISESILLCKMFEYANDIYFFIYKDNEIKVYLYNIITAEFNINDSLSILANTSVPNNITANMLAAFVDKSLNRIFIITCSDSQSYKIYNLTSASAENVISLNHDDLAGRHIVHSGINYDNTIVNEGLFVILDNNTIYFFSKNDTAIITRVIIKGSYGINNIVRYKDSNETIKYLIFYTKADGTQNFVTINALSLYGEDITINIAGIPAEPLVQVFSNKINIAGYIFNTAAHLNLIYGSYEEGGINRPLIKQLSYALFSGQEHPFILQGNLEKSSGIINVEGAAYGNMQLSRLHLRAEDIDNEETPPPANTDVFLHENETDDTHFTTGSYLWKQLYKIGLPFNKHVETAGRIIIDGYDIPVFKTYITRAKDDNGYGDVLLTFDKYFNANVIKGALHENITQYPGALFFKNKGFLADAIISNSYEMEGTLNYNDEANGNLFNIGIHAITACKIVGDILLVAGNYGCLASININTKGYTNINGESMGDTPPPYYIVPVTVTSGQEPDNIKAIVPWENKIFILTNQGKLFRTYSNTNSWIEIENPDLELTSNLVHYLNNRNIKAYAVKDNLLLISWPFGSLSSFDLESEVYTRVAHGDVFPNTPYPEHDPITSSTTTGNSLTIGNKIYFVGGIAEVTGNTLCWFDTHSKTFSYAKGFCEHFNMRVKDRVDLTTDGKDIYLLFSYDVHAVLVKYDVNLDAFTILESTSFKHSRCGIYYYNNCIYALFGIDENDDKYIQKYSLVTRNWVSYKVNNQDLPSLYGAQGFLQQGTSNGLPFTKVILFWGISTDEISGEVEFSNIVEIELQNIVNPQDSVAISLDLDDIFSGLRFIGYSLEYDVVRNEVYVVNGLISGTQDISTKVYRINFDTKAIILSYDKLKPYGSFNNVSGLINHYLFNIGGYINSVFAIEENIDLLNIRDGEWSEVKSLAYDAESTLTNDYIPVITSMKIIYPGNMLVISYMDGGVGSFDLRTGKMILPSETHHVTLNCIHALPGAYSDKGAYTIYEDDEDVVFVCVDHEFKFAKHIGVFFKKQAKDSSKLTLVTQSTRPHPLTGSSQVVIGKYIVYLNGYDHNESNWQETIHRNIVVLDTCTGEYAILANDKLIEYRYNAFSYYYNGYIYTFGGIQRYTRYGSIDESVLEYERRAIIERYDLVTGQAIILPTTFGIELNESPNATVGRNQIVHLTPFSCFGLREDNTILASIILANDNVGNNYLIRRMFFFDLISETEYSLLTLPDIEFGNDSAVILCERKATKELYAFQFHTEMDPPLVDHNIFCELSIFKYTLNEGTIEEAQIISRVPIKSPLKHQNYISGLSEIIYNEETDTFAIPILAQNLPSISDKNYIATTIGYEFNPRALTIRECTRDGINPVKLMKNENSLPLNKMILDEQQQYDSTSLLRAHIINDTYTFVNPISETMTQYSKEELFGHKYTLINSAPYDEWSNENKVLYTLFTYKEEAFEIAPHVNPGMDNFTHQYKGIIMRAVIMPANSLLAPLLEDIPLIEMPGINQSLFLIIGFDLNLKTFSVLYSEVISGVNNHSYSVVSGLVNGILWAFIHYIDEDISYNPIISYDINTKTIGHHPFTRVIGDYYGVSSQYDLPRCIIDEEHELLHIALVNRSQLNHSFTGVVYTFFGLNYTAHVSGITVSQANATFNTLLPSGTDYYLTLAINCNGYIYEHNLFLDIFNGEDGEVSYTVKLPLNIQGLIKQDEIKVRYLDQYYRSISLENTTYIKSFKDGIIQDIYGYKISYKNNKKLINPIIAIDSFDVIKDSRYEKTRSYILFDRLDTEVPKAFVSLTEHEHETNILIQNNEGLLYFSHDTNGLVSIIQVNEITNNKYTNIKKTGQLPVPYDIEDDEIISTKSIKLNKNTLLSCFITNETNKIFLYQFSIKERMYSLVNTINNAIKNFIDGEAILIEDKLYFIGRNAANTNYIDLYEFDIYMGILLEAKSLLATEIKNIKAIYNKQEQTIYLLGGTVVSTALPNIIIYAYNIETKTINPYLSSSLLDGEVIDAYYYEDFNKTFIQLKTDTPSTGSLLVLKHDNATVIQQDGFDIPIAADRMIKTKNGALAYINKDFESGNGVHYIFDPVTFTYIDIAYNDITGSNLNNEAPSEIIPLENSNVFMGLRIRDTQKLQWAIGPLFFTNARYSPLELFATKRLFIFDSDIFLYGKENQHEIHKYNKLTKSFELYDTISYDGDDNRYFTSKVYLDGNIRICFATPSVNQNEIQVTFVLYNIPGKKLITITNTPIVVTPSVNGVYANLDLSIKPLWISHYLLFILHSPNHLEHFVIRINLLNGIAISHAVHDAINAQSTLEWYYDRILSFGGHLPGNDDVNYDIGSFRIDTNNTEQTAAKYTLPIYHDAIIKSNFIMLKSAKKLSGIYLNALLANGFEGNSAVIHYDDTTIDSIMAELTDFGGNGALHGDAYIPYIVPHYLPRKFAHEIQIPTFESTEYLNDERIKPYHIPYKDNCLLIGVYDKLINPTYVSPIANYDLTTKLRIAHLNPDLINAYISFDYLVCFYSGVTQDTIKTLNRYTKEEIYNVSFERDYGTVITGIEPLDDDKYILTYDNGPAIGTVIVYKDGSLTIKRYDGVIFGKSIDPGTNSHTIQEVDLTFLFDVESSEYDLRKESM
jgi:hypothetical protein